MMTENTHIARPYAIAAFEYALSQNQTESWERFLTAATTIANDNLVEKFLSNPRSTEVQRVQLFLDILTQMLDDAQRNFIELLGEHDRLAVLPSILKLFKQYRAEKEMHVTVQLISAVPLDQDYQLKITQALSKRLQKKVTVENQIDPKLIAGAIIRAGDRVIDGSVRGKLTRLFESL